MINVSSEKENDLAVTFELIFKIWLRWLLSKLYQFTNQLLRSQKLINVLVSMLTRLSKKSSSHLI